MTSTHSKSSENRSITKQIINRDLEKIGVQKGDHLGLGISYKSIGYVNGGPEAFIDALIEAVGSEGTIMMNAYTNFFSISQVQFGWTDYVFEPELTKANTGIVPETFRKYKNSIRSRHPTNSVVAYGRWAKFLTDGHDENASAYLPYSRLSEIDGKFLAVGIGDSLVGLRHQAQYAAGLLTIVPWKSAVRYRDNNGKLKTFIRRDLGGCVRRLPELVAYLQEEELVTRGTIGMAKAIMVPARESLEIMTNILKNNPEMNICDKVSCFWCREIERRMNLYQRIENPRYFQKNIFFIYLLATINWLRKRDNRIVTIFKLLFAKIKITVLSKKKEL
jgi:aminoglycoside 3-N-acetyltransferase